jgi:chaperonin GroES
MTNPATINTSGIEPLDLRVLVLPDVIEEKTTGGIIMPETVREREKYAKVEATIIAVGENAWEEAAERSARFTKPKPGDRVMIQKWGGVDYTGQDGRMYRLLNDNDVLGRIV